MIREALGRDAWARRRDAVAGNRTMRGLDHVEALDAPQPGKPLRLRLHFVPSDVAAKTAAPSGLTHANLRVAGPFGSLWATVVETQPERGWVDVEVAPPTAEARWEVTTPFDLSLVDVPDVDPYFERATFRLHPALLVPEEPDRPAPLRPARPGPRSTT